jgi:hypothetical protein
MEALLPLIEKTFPIPPRFRRGLAPAVAVLSRLLTSGRGDRPLSYLNRPTVLSAYLRYFLPWNVYRLCRLLPSLELPLAAGDRILDLGAGPLTLPISLWLCRPDLRGLALEFRCLDRSRAALEAGKKLFAALGPAAPWTINTVCAGMGPSRGRSAGAALVAAINVYNEVFQPVSPGDDGGLRRFAGAQGALLASYAGGGGRILVVEPGTPRSGRFISLLREALAGLGRPPLSPCAHRGPCPFPGRGPARPGLDRDSGPSYGKGAAKWCHFAFDAQGAPAALRRLSEVAGLPKERAVLSFLLAGPAVKGAENAQGIGAEIPEELERIARSGGRRAAAGCAQIPNPGDPAHSGGTRRVLLRVISDPFPLGGDWGRYGCASEGMALVRGGRTLIGSLPSGALIEALSTGRRDSKSGALLCLPVPPEGARPAGRP